MALIIGAVLLVLLVGTASLVTIRPVALFGASNVPPSAAPSRYGVTSAPPVLAGAGTGAPVPGQSVVAAAVKPPLADSRLGSHVSVRVTDVLTGQELYASNATQATTPASTMKLATSIAALATRGPAYQFQTRVVAGTNPGEVVIIGGGDPTLAVNDVGSYPGAARLDDLAQQVKSALGGIAPTKVIYDVSLFTGSQTGPDWDLTDVDGGGQVARITPLMTDGGRTNPKVVAPPSARSTQPDLSAAQSFAKLLGLPISAVAKGTAPTSTGSAASGGTPAPGTQLGVVRSAPLQRILEQMLSGSDNTVAETVARQVALAQNQPASFAGGAAAVIATLGDLGLDITGLKIVDGSGLSNDNKLNATLLTKLLVLATQEDKPQLHGLFTGLAVAGYSGSLTNRFRTPSANPADGAIRAKTGTLTGVSALAGYVTDAGGRLLAFAILADKITTNSIEAEAALDKVGIALAQLS
jgi:D-alanyl-D-alanine carboxypeptidase/D-alanyl-D-alanine-endopeptidase (penicillin-binding protein 4)